jgi:hypothetical protein
MKLVLLVLLSLLPACSRRYAGIADGEFTVIGIVVDTKGNPVHGARIKGLNRVVTSDTSGCFHLFEITAENKHDFPFVLEARGFERIAGELSAPGRVRLRVTATTITSGFADAVAVNPPPSFLGPCEAKAGR